MQVEVKDGVVTFKGAITDERLRDGLKVIAKYTGGAAIHDHMAWIDIGSSPSATTAASSRSFRERLCAWGGHLRDEREAAKRNSPL